MARIILILLMVLPCISFAKDDTQQEMIQKEMIQQEQKIQTRIDLVCRQEIKTTFLNINIADEYYRQLKVLYSTSRVSVGQFERTRQKIQLDKQYFQWKYQALTIQCQEEGALTTEQLKEILIEANESQIEGIDVRNYME